MADKINFYRARGFMVRWNGEHNRRMGFLLCFFEFLSCISSCYRLKVLKFPVGPAEPIDGTNKLLGTEGGGR
jgi:hypothetical protein